MGARPALAVMVAWPIYIFLMRKTANRLLHRMEKTASLHHYQSMDVSEPYREWSDEDVSSWRLAITREFGRGGPTALPALIFITLVTVGTFLIWQLISYSCELVADMIVDGGLAEKRFSTAALSEAWLGNAFAATTVHFVGFAVVAWLFAGFLSCFGRP